MYAAAAVQSFNSHEEFVVCGGWDPGAKGSGGSFTDAVHALNLDTLEWMRDDPLPCGPVSRHGAAAVDGRIFIHTFREGVGAPRGTSSSGGSRRRRGYGADRAWPTTSCRRRGYSVNRL